MRLSDYRLKFAELIGLWTTDHSNKKNKILTKGDKGVPAAIKGLKDCKKDGVENNRKKIYFFHP